MTTLGDTQTNTTKYTLTTDIVVRIVKVDREETSEWCLATLEDGSVLRISKSELVAQGV